MNSDLIIPNNENLQLAYDSYKPVLTAILFSIEQKLKKNLKLGLFLEKSIEMYYKTYQFIE